MAFLLDTNVISETVRPKPHRQVLDWIAAQSAGDLFLASMTIGELMRGARKQKNADRRRKFERWIGGELVDQFEGRILAFDHAAALIWGEIMGDGDRTGKMRPAADALIASVARRNRLTLATRNTKDFPGMEVKLFNPWTGK